MARGILHVLAAIALYAPAVTGFSTGARSALLQRTQLHVRPSQCRVALRSAPAAVQMGLPGFPLGGGGGFLNVGTPELIVIGGLAWLLLGPKELFRLSREAGILIGNLRKLGTDAADQFRDAIESEMVMDEIEVEKRAIEDSMLQIKTGKKATAAEDAFGNLGDEKE
jgi:Sec-independent protein translocase protein TatA